MADIIKNSDTTEDNNEIKSNEEVNNPNIKIVNPDPGTPDGYFKMVKELHDDNTKKTEQIDQLMNRLDDIVASQKQNKVQRPQLWSPSDAGFDSKFYGGNDFNGNIGDMISVSSSDGFVKHIQEMSDNILILNSIMKKSNPLYDVKESKLYQNFNNDLEKFNIKAMAGASGFAGNPWIPTNFSASLIELVRLELKVANLHERIFMPTKQFTLPVEGGDMFSYLASESTSDTSSSIKTSTPATNSVTFTAQKLATRVLFSTEVEEDSIISILPMIRKRIAHALASGLEYAIINGDTAGTRDSTDQTGNTIDSSSNLKAFNGYRKIASDIGQGVSIDAGGSFLTHGDHIRRARASMGKYGANPTQVAIVTGNRGYLKHILGIKPVQTVDKIGDIATINTGVLSRFEGSDIILSEWVREDLNGSGVSGGVSGNVDTHIQLIHKKSFAIGDRRNLSIKTAEVIDTDQVKVVATQRLDFKGFYPTSERTTAQVYDLE